MNKTLLQCLLLSFATLSYSLPLSTRSRWIVDEPTGARVKFACVNWAAHLEPMLAEGLDKKSLADIARHVAQMGFNCVRLTWATHMFTRYANLTVAQSFRNLGLQDSIKGIAQNNPEFLNLSLVNAQRAVIDELVHQGVMVVLDNHVSHPSWCCGDNDGNGFFGDKYFDPIEWLQGLAIVAKLHKNTSMVVGMSLRNELRGPLQNTSEWYRNIERGARTINEANPSLLVIVSGLHYDLSFAFLKKNPLKLNFKNKLVYEIHRYAFTAGQRELWLNQPFTKACENITQEIHRQAGFLVEGENVAPLIASEFGIKQVDVDRADSLFLGCFLGYLAEMDLDWGVWALQGSYYIRHGLHGLDETYGMLSSNWSSIRSPDFQQKLQLIQQQTQGPNSIGPTYQILHHPSSGRCIRVDSKSEIHASDCWGFSKWNYNGKGNPIWLDGTGLCLTAVGDGIPVTLSLDCGNRRSQWELISSSNFQVANKDENGKYLCLDWDPNYSSKVFTKNCQESPHESQWFKLISANTQ
ncbi:endoglucanase [Phtheirospermum japonicum]|uniref:Endoglucanase n=1 Tax=Phtheirospermum japonicum TaxID=374723 RepID=A0A830BN37_9LAMI|nr:endoglucanase [Phtheirospermum japonicum]